MELKDFMNMNKLQEIQNNFSEATGLAAIAVGKNGEYITEGSNFTDFCMLNCNPRFHTRYLG